MWGECNNDIIRKINISNTNNKSKVIRADKYNNIYGYISTDKRGKIIFKIVDKTIEKDSLTVRKKKSKRAEIKGRACNTFNVPRLLKIEDKIGIKQDGSKKFRNYICNEIEIFLRIKNNDNYNNKIWFVDERL